MYPLGYDQNGFVATPTYITHIYIRLKVSKNPLD